MATMVSPAFALVRRRANGGETIWRRPSSAEIDTNDRAARPAKENISHIGLLPGIRRSLFVDAKAEGGEEIPGVIFESEAHGGSSRSLQSGPFPRRCWL